MSFPPKLPSGTLRQRYVAVAIAAAFGTNILANIRPIGGLTIGDISQTFFSDVLILPANYAFIIWSVIYLGLFSFAIYQLLPAQRQSLTLKIAGYGVAAASIAQIIWVYLFQLQQFGLSVLAMVAIAVPLGITYQKIGVGQYRPISAQERWLVHIPISLYFAWICVATVINVTTALTFYGWNGFGVLPNSFWETLILWLVMILPATISQRNVKRWDPTFNLVFVWALVAIAVRQYSLEQASAFAPLVYAAVIIAYTPVLFFQWKRSVKTKASE